MCAAFAMYAPPASETTITLAPVASVFTSVADLAQRFAPTRMALGDLLEPRRPIFIALHYPIGTYRLTAVVVGLPVITTWQWRAERGKELYE